MRCGPGGVWREIRLPRVHKFSFWDPRIMRTEVFSSLAWFLCCLVLEYESQIYLNYTSLPKPDPRQPTSASQPNHGLVPRPFSTTNRHVNENHGTEQRCLQSRPKNDQGRSQRIFNQSVQFAGTKSQHRQLRRQIENGFPTSSWCIFSYQSV